MPIAKVRLPDGRIGRFNVPEGTTSEQVVEFAKAQDLGAPAPVQPISTTPPSAPEVAQPAPLAGGVPTPSDVAILEPAATLVSGAIAEPVAGLAGLGALIGTGDPSRATELIERVRKAGTFQPRGEAGQRTLQKIGKALEPVGEVFEATETFLGDETFKATGSPALAAAAATLPTALIEAIGIGGTKGFIKGATKTKRLATNRAVKKAVVAAAPEIDDIKNTSRAVYTELSDSGVSVKPEAYKSLVSKIDDTLKKEKFREGSLAPQTTTAIKELRKEVGNAQTLDDIDALRQQVTGVLGPTSTPNDKRLIGVITESMDDFLDEAKPDNFIKGTLEPSEILPKYKVARELWGRARRSELINDAFSNAELARAGFESGLVSEFRRILKNKRVNRFFKPEEIEAMRNVVKGSTPKNIALAVGRFGGPVGFAGGGLAFGGPGAVTISGIGQVSKKLSQKLTSRGAEFADAVIRAGDNADSIVRAYLKNTPKKARDASELSELLLRPDIAIDKLLISPNKLIKEASEITTGMRIFQAAGVAPTVAAPGLLESLSTINQMSPSQEQPQQEQSFTPTQQNRLSRKLGEVNFAR